MHKIFRIVQSYVESGELNVDIDDLNIDIGDTISIYCGDNVIGLKSLPLWRNVVEVISYCKDLETLPLWPGVEKVVLVDCEKLERLPLWPNIYKVELENCTRLTHLPLWRTIKQIYITNSPVVNLPLWRNIEKIKLIDLSRLVNLPLWPNIGKIELINLPRIINLPLWSNIKKIEVVNLPRLINLPLWSGSPVVVNDSQISGSFRPDITRFISPKQGILYRDYRDFPYTSGWTRPTRIDTNGICSICASNFENGDDLLQQVCVRGAKVFRTFHKECLYIWYRSVGTYPPCISAQFGKRKSKQNLRKSKQNLRKSKQNSRKYKQNSRKSNKKSNKI